jgi:hypothetical protein
MDLRLVRDMMSAYTDPRVMITRDGIHCVAAFHNVPIFANAGKGIERFEGDGLLLATFDPALILKRSEDSLRVIADCLYPFNRDSKQS